jgi:hypothetical protein
MFKPIQKIIGIGNRGQQNNLGMLDDIIDGVRGGVPKRTTPRPEAPGVPIRDTTKPKPNQQPKPPVADDVPTTVKPPVADDVPTTVKPTLPAPEPIGTNPSRSYTLRDINQSNTDNSKNYNIEYLKLGYIFKRYHYLNFSMITEIFDIFEVIFKYLGFELYMDLEYYFSMYKNQILKNFESVKSLEIPNIKRNYENNSDSIDIIEFQDTFGLFYEFIIKNSIDTSNYTIDDFDKIFESELENIRSNKLMETNNYNFVYQDEDDVDVDVEVEDKENNLNNPNNGAGSGQDTERRNLNPNPKP